MCHNFLRVSVLNSQRRNKIVITKWNSWREYFSFLSGNILLVIITNNELHHLKLSQIHLQVAPLSSSLFHSLLYVSVVGNRTIQKMDEGIYLRAENDTLVPAQDLRLWIYFSSHCMSIHTCSIEVVCRLVGWLVSRDLVVKAH